MRLHYMEIPLEIWISVRDKWTHALETGWSWEHWNPCALCTYIREEHHTDNACDMCPLPSGRYCTGSADSSKLSMVSKSVDYSEEQWRKNVEYFISMVDTIIEKLNIFHQKSV